MTLLKFLDIIFLLAIMYSTYRCLKNKKDRKTFGILLIILVTISSIVDVLLLKWDFLPRDLTTRVDKIVRMCEKKDAEACYVLADGNERKGNITKAIKYFKKACDYGDVVACVNASYHISKNYNTKEAHEESLSFAKKACDLGNYLGCFNVACSYCSLKDAKTSLTYFEKSFIMGYRNWKNIETDKGIDCIRDMDGFKKILSKK